ncbi:hypothetical protein [Bacillus sp. FJAT-45037]|uniref:hypothetical protein n=1 Tax=Bacillus sp. FJAT-45037 TaxID=2011007 RepID=UPI0012FD8564|nr:hypothetical protein [Bacillus sp. FJAT-45037]
MMVTTIVLLFFALFLGIMLLGNHMSNLFEQILEKEADKVLARIDEALKEEVK